MAPSHNVNDLNFATEIFFCKTLVVDEKIWILQWTDVESQMGKSCKVSALKLWPASNALVISDYY